ncbi:hypothetical protein ABPG74_009971 [Tetrahymena malaccensis]
MERKISQKLIKGFLSDSSSKSVDKPSNIFYKFNKFQFQIQLILKILLKSDNYLSVPKIVHLVYLQISLKQKSIMFVQEQKIYLHDWQYFNPILKIVIIR